MSYNYRNVGLGIFGYATALMKLGMRYGSCEAIGWTDTIFGLMFRAAVIESNNLAKEFGPYPKYKDCVWDSDIIKAHFMQEEIDRMREYGLRNVSLISIAPTGSIATMLGESGGCEPEFAIKYTRRTVGMTEGEDTYYDVYCKAAREYMELNHTKELPSYFVCSKDIPWIDRVATQAVMQNHVDTGISSTVNLPNEATIEDVEKLYLDAWMRGLKGITVFRDGCKRMPILSTKKEKPETASVSRDIRKVGKIRKLTTGCGSLHLNALFDADTGDLVEIFLNKGSSGGCNNFMIGLSRMVSLACKKNCDIYEIVDQLKSCGVCPSYAVRTATKKDTSRGSCCPVAVGNALIEMWGEMRNELRFTGYSEVGESKPVSETHEQRRVEESHEDHIEDQSDTQGQACPICHSPIDHSGGCDICTNCGWSKCE